MKAPKFPNSEEEAIRSRTKSKLLTKQECQEYEEARKQKDRDKHKITDKKRKRPLTIAFRVTQNERDMIYNRIALSGLSRQEYMTKAILEAPLRIVATRNVIDQCKSELHQIEKELSRLESYNDLDEVKRKDLLSVIEICKAALK